jgi:hypothetical protein
LIEREKKILSTACESPSVITTLSGFPKREILNPANPLAPAANSHTDLDLNEGERGKN